MANLYEVLGVERGSTKDEIRAAYRAKTSTAVGPERMQLNRAWNVLSDDYQRERYDADLAAGVAEEVQVSDISPAAAPSRRGGDAGSSSKAEQRQKAMEARMEAMKKRFPPVPMPAGFEQAKPKARGLAFAIDSFLIFLVLVGGVVGQVSLQTPLNASQKAQQRANDCVQYVGDIEIAYIDKKKPDTDTKLNERCASSLEQLDKKELESLTTAEAKAQKKAVNKRIDDAVAASEKLIPARNASQYAVAFGSVLLSLLLLIGTALKNGQTIGKRLKGVYIRKVDGSVPGIATLGRRYGLVAVALASFLFVGPIGQFVMIGLMFIGTNWSNNPNRQSTLDRWAGTLVLEKIAPE